ncbi:MAG: hypothetical protein HXX08_22560 [Chloroflexi bacterium]|uniref:Uncharacterized protein n=1 Tax=Candidatus Chlorohelix allophototropha TaxID=3003348 RepID=A0A8T7M9N7_9CHLR|nr:hypothetical protein [Chloroflexota bacterium]WJW68582.1 hypothetical protein OZ401_004196 [Chloroflexota bacterium L227-S17]
MPVLTNYWFQDTDFRGNTQFLNIGHPAGGWAFINWGNIGSTHSTLVWEREDREFVVDLLPILNASDVLAGVDRIFGGGEAHRTSGIKAGWIPWRYVPYHSKDPGRHADMDLLVRIFFNFHVSTPWYCSDADGDIDYYVVLFLDGAGHLHAHVDGWSYHYNGGGPFCTGAINDRLNGGVPGGVATLQAMLDSRLALFADRRFDMIYLLPGDGTRSGGGAVNVNEHVSLALLPR